MCFSFQLYLYNGYMLQIKLVEVGRNNRMGIEIGAHKQTLTITPIHWHNIEARRCSREHTQKERQWRAGSRRGEAKLFSARANELKCEMR